MMLNSLVVLLALVVCAYGGINEWTYVGLAPEYINSIEVDPTNSDIVYVSAYDVYGDSTAEGGLFRTTDHGLTWDTLGFRHSNVNDVAVDRMNPQIVWIANDEWGAWRSSDRGETWENRSAGIYLGGADHYGPDKIGVCPHDSQYLVCLTASWVGLGQVYFTDAAGLPWQWNTDMWVGGKRFLAFDPCSPGVVYVTDWDLNFLYVSTDTGRTYSPSSWWGYATVYGLKTAPSSPGAVWRLTRQLGLQVSLDYGHSWVRETERFFGTDTIIWDMDVVGAGDTLALASNYGPYLTFDTGETVFPLDTRYPEGDPADVVRVISVDPLEIWVRARRHGIWTYTYLPDTTTVGRQTPLHSLVQHLTIGPNPTTGRLWITLHNAQSAAGGTRIEMYNVLGQRIVTWLWDSAHPSMSVELPASLSTGTYFISVASDRREAIHARTQSFLLVH